MVGKPRPPAAGARTRAAATPGQETGQDSCLGPPHSGPLPGPGPVPGSSPSPGSSGPPVPGDGSMGVTPANGTYAMSRPSPMTTPRGPTASTSALDRTLS